MSFPLVGNGRIKESISALVAAKRLPHAVIIEGDVGTGKRTLAKYLAKKKYLSQFLEYYSSLIQAHPIFAECRLLQDLNFLIVNLYFLE